jgi:hypothetical protein
MLIAEKGPFSRPGVNLIKNFGVNLLTLYHRDRTRVQMLAKIFPHLKVKCLLFMGPTLGFDTKQRHSFLIKFGIFYN